VFREQRKAEQKTQKVRQDYPFMQEMPAEARQPGPVLEARERDLVGDQRCKPGQRDA